MNRLSRWWNVKKMYWLGYFLGRVLTEKQVEFIAKLRR